MAGPQEVFSFMTKFMNLWQMGSEAQVHVQCQAPPAYVVANGVLQLELLLQLLDKLLR